MTTNCEVKKVVETINTFSGCQLQALFRQLLPLFSGCCVSDEYLGEIDTDSILTEIAENRDVEAKDFLLELFKTFTPVDDEHLVKEFQELVERAECEAGIESDKFDDEAAGLCGDY